MRIIYSLGIAFFRLGIWLAYPFKEKARLMINGRKGWKSKLTDSIDPNAKYTWFHCSSLGEFEQGRPVLEAYRKKYKHEKIVLTFFSPSGYEIRKNYDQADIILYLPFDTPSNVKAFLNLIQPQKAFFVKYDYWFYFLEGLKKRDIPSYLISAIYRKNQLFFRWYGSWYRKMLNMFTKIFVQNDASGDLLRQAGITNWQKAGDTRFDRVAALPETRFSDMVLDAFCKDTNTVICGSTWPKDENLISNYIKAITSKADIKFIVAPHEIHESHIQHILSELSDISVCRYTKTEAKEAENCSVLLIDTIGKLSFVYRYGFMAYVGGGFGVGIHNTLEAAVYNLPVIFGPNYHKFNEACDLINLKAAHSASDFPSLKKMFDRYIFNKEAAEKTGRIAGEYVRKQSGATHTILQNI